MDDINELKETVKSSLTIHQILGKLRRADTRWSYTWFNKITKENGIDTNHLLSKSDYAKLQSNDGKIKKLTDDLIFCENSSISRGLVKRRLMKSGKIPYKCNLCDMLDVWNGKKMSLILDHINGIRNDNREENLRFLCPNCNSTLNTHCVGNRRQIKIIGPRVPRKIDITKRIYTRKVARPTLDVLLKETAELGFLGAGRKYGVSDNCLRKWIRIYEKYNTVT